MQDNMNTPIPQGEDNLSFYYADPKVTKEIMKFRLLLLPASLCLFSLIFLLVIYTEKAVNGTYFLPLIMSFLPVLFTLMLCGVVAFGVNPFAVQRICYARKNERLWRIALDILPRCAHVKLPHINMWHAKNPALMLPEERMLVESAIKEAICRCEAGTNGFPGAIYEMREPRIIAQTRRKTSVGYWINGNITQKTIPNVYEGLFAHTADIKELVPAGVKVAAIVITGLVIFSTLASFAVTLIGISRQDPQEQRGYQESSGYRQQADAGSDPMQLRLTEENYQKIFLPEDEYRYIVRAYYKAPYNRDGKTAFVDAYLPGDGTISYPDDGFAIEAEAHGMRVYQTMKHTDENARSVVEQAYQAMADAGVDFYQDGVYETQYDESYDIAVKQVTYFEDGMTKPRIAFLYADTRTDGYYMYSQITYLPEQFDDGHEGLLTELRDVFAMNLPDIPAMT